MTNWAIFYRHSREGGNPWAFRWLRGFWIPAFAGMTMTNIAFANLAADLHTAWHQPRATAFAEAAANLAPKLQDYCAAAPDQASARVPAQQAWLNAMQRWETLNAAGIGPVLARRAQRQLDFSPSRPKLIAQAIAAAPADLKALESVGTPAKGLPALAWLLWTQPIAPATAECRYAVLLAQELAHESRLLAEAAAPELDDATALSELVNQWVGGVERLRWHGLEMPTRVALTSHGKAAAEYPRGESGGEALAWAAQWAGLRELAVGPTSLAAALRARGQAALAAELARQVKALDARMHRLKPADAKRILAAAKSLAGLKAWVENTAAPALGVNIGFSDADGD